MKIKHTLAIIASYTFAFMLSSLILYPFGGILTLIVYLVAFGYGIPFLLVFAAPLVMMDEVVKKYLFGICASGIVLFPVFWTLTLYFMTAGPETSLIAFYKFAHIHHHIRMSGLCGIIGFSTYYFLASKLFEDSE